MKNSILETTNKEVYLDNLLSQFHIDDIDSFQSLTLAPIMLFVGYIIVIPAALVYRDKSKKN